MSLGYQFPDGYTGARTSTMSRRTSAAAGSDNLQPTAHARTSAIDFVSASASWGVSWWNCRLATALAESCGGVLWCGDKSSLLLFTGICGIQGGFPFTPALCSADPTHSGP